MYVVYKFRRLPARYKSNMALINPDGTTFGAFDSHHILMLNITIKFTAKCLCVWGPCVGKPSDFITAGGNPEGTRYGVLSMKYVRCLKQPLV